MGADPDTKRTSINDLIEHFGMGKFQVIYIVSMFIISMADGVEILTLSFIGILLQCAWNISSAEVAMMMPCVFVGMIVGSAIFGNLSDRYGRKPLLMLASSMTLFFGVLSCAVPTFFWFCFLRLAMGCGIGGSISVVSPFLSEISPTYFRAKSQSIMFLSWSFGCFLVIGIAALVIPYLGWRWFIFFASLPLIVGIILLSFGDESVRFLILSGQREKAMKVIKKFSRMNNVSIPPGPIALSNSQASEKRSEYIGLLFSKRYRLLSILQFLNWFAAGLLYYGAVIFSTNMPSIAYSCLQNKSLVFHSVLPDDGGCCKELNHEFYVHVAISTMGEFVSIFVDAYMLDLIGRKLGIVVCATISGTCFFLLNFCMPVMMRSFVFLVLRCFTFALYNGWFIFTLELYPTLIRNTGFGFCQLFGRIGGAVTSFCSVVLLRYNTELTLFIYVGISVVAAIWTLCIPVETRNAPLDDDAPMDETGDMLRSNVNKYASVD